MTGPGSPRSDLEIVVPGDGWRSSSSPTRLGLLRRGFVRPHTVTVDREGPHSLTFALIGVTIAALYFSARAHSAERVTQELWSLCNRLLFEAAKGRERQARHKEK